MLSTTFFPMLLILVIVLFIGMRIGGIGIGLMAALPAVESFYIIPTYPTLQGAITLDHSFMIPGLITTLFGTIIAYLIVHYIVI